MSQLNVSFPEPLLSIEAYANRVGETKKVISDLVKDGHLPSIQPAGARGKRYINMVALTKQLMESYDNQPQHNKVGW